MMNKVEFINKILNRKLYVGNKVKFRRDLIPGEVYDELALYSGHMINAIIANNYKGTIVDLYGDSEKTFRIQGSSFYYSVEMLEEDDD